MSETDDAADHDRAVDLVRSELDAEEVTEPADEKPRGALVPPNRVGPKMAGPPPPGRRRTHGH